MAYGSLKALFTSLQEAPTLQGVSVVYGEENLTASEPALPMVVIVPVGGPFQHGSGYIKGQSVRAWGLREQIDLYLWAISTEPAEQQPIDHAAAVEDLRAQVLQALNFQRWAGLMFKPASAEWEREGDAETRYGRRLKLSVSVDISIPDVIPATATVTSLEIDGSINT